MARPERIDAVLFDFDGTLCNTEMENLRLVRDVLRRMGAEVPLSELEVLTGGEDRVTVPPILEKYGVAGTIDDYERLRDNCYRTYAEAPLALEPGALDLLDGLRARGVRVGLVSMTVARCILPGVARLGILNLFDVVVCGDSIASASAAGCHVIAYTGCEIVQDVSAADEVVSSFLGLEL